MSQHSTVPFRGQAVLSFDRGTILARLPETEPIRPPLVRDTRVGLPRAPASAYHEVLAVLRSRGLSVRDEVDTWSPRALRLPPLAKDLRPYQQDALWAWERAGRRGIVCLPTGAGKTILGLEAIRRVGLPTLVLVPTRVLLHQWAGQLRDAFGLRVGMVGDGFRRPEWLTVATFESGYRHVDWLGGRFGLLVVDEVHHFGSGARSDALAGSAAPYRLGLTATPPSDPERAGRLTRLVGPVVARVALPGLVGTYLAPFEHVVLAVELTPAERLRYDRHTATFLSEFRSFKAERPDGTWPEFVDWARERPNGLAAVAAWHRSQEIVSLARRKIQAVSDLLDRHAHNRVLLFTRTNAAAYEISRRELVPAITQHVGRRERSWILEAFRKGEVRAIVSSRVLNEGLDVPEADVAILLGGAFGVREFLQRSGRVLRQRASKRAVLYEVVVAETSESRKLRDHVRVLAGDGSTEQSPGRPAGRESC